MSKMLPQSPFRLKTHQCHVISEVSEQKELKKSRDSDFERSARDLYLSRIRFIIHYSFTETV